MKALAAFVGKLLLFLASMALITGMSLFVVGGWLVTLPILRLSPRNRRMTALMGAGAAMMTLAQAYGLMPDGTEEHDG